MKTPHLLLATLSLFLLGCQMQVSEEATTPDIGSKEYCRNWIEDTQERCDKEIGEWKDKLSATQNETGEVSTTFKKAGMMGGVEYERYHNKMLGYTIEIPKSWGAMYPMGGTFTDDLYDEMETIGPYLGNGTNNIGHNIETEVFSHKNTNKNAFEDYESLFDFYEAFRLENKNYITREESNKIITENAGYPIKEFDELNEDGEYLMTRRVMLSNDSAYVFIYNKNNNIHVNIIRSIEIDSPNQVEVLNDADRF